MGYEPAARVVLAVIVIYLLSWLRTVVFSLLPHAVVQYGRRLWLRHRGSRIQLRTRVVSAIDVELRPEPVGEVFVIELEDGAVYDLCPVRWDGAERIYTVLARRVRRGRLRKDRRKSRGQPGSDPG